MAFICIGSRLASRLPRPGASALSGGHAAFQLVAWLNTNSDHSLDAVEVAKALRTNVFQETELVQLRAERSAISHAALIDFMRQRCGIARQRTRQLP
jgi:ABC-type taurine transport system ATPase subunit